MATATSPAVSAYQRHRGVWVGLVVSALLHLVFAYLARDLWLEHSAPPAFRARLAQIPRFEPKRLAVARTPAAARIAMEHLASQEQPEQLGDVPLGALMQRLTETEPPTQPLVLREFTSGAKEDEPLLERVRMLRPTAFGLADSVSLPSADLLRIVDMARANRQHAMVILDPHNRRDMLGYVNLARLKLYGAGTHAGPALDALARYVRDHSNILVQVSARDRRYFLSPELMKDPVLFLFQGGGYDAYDDNMMSYFSAAEKAHLGTYLRHGGFLFVEGVNRYLREMVDHLKEVLGGDGHLFPLPPDHPLYHSYFDFDDGYPGEQGKSSVNSPQISRGWYYPALAPPEATGGAATSLVNPEQVQADAETPRPLGLWGVEWQGQTVAVLSDVGLHQLWAQSFAPVEVPEPVGPALNAGLNILFYALTREGSLTPQQERPMWLATRPEAVWRDSAGAGVAEAVPDEELLSALDAALVVVRAPLGTRMETEPLTLRLNGVYALELPSTRAHGILLHNMPTGTHWLELNYGGQTRQLRIALAGGQVTTVTFGINRFAFLRQLRLGLEERRVRLDQWRAGFADLELEEFFLAEDRDLIERQARTLRR